MYVTKKRDLICAFLASALNLLMANLLQVKSNVESVLKNTIPNYRDDPDLQSIMDWIQINVSIFVFHFCHYTA